MLQGKNWLKNFQLITELLDVEKNPARPQYEYANEASLCFFDCNFDSSFNLDWHWDLGIVNDVLTSLQLSWAELQSKYAWLSILDIFYRASILQSMMTSLSNQCYGSVPAAGFSNFMRGGATKKVIFLESRKLSIRFMCL